MELRLSLREAAEQIGADVFSLMNWEKGKTEPAIRFWPGIIAFLGYDPSSLPVTLGDHIRSERRRRGCSLALLARECGLDQATLALIETDAYSRIDPRVRASHTALQMRYASATNAT
jgi:DNA-binding XRE family transcriptional regulator